MKNFSFMALAIFCFSMAACNNTETTTEKTTPVTNISQPTVTTPANDTMAHMEEAEEPVLIAGDIYRSALGDIHVRYFEKDGKKFVGLLKNEDPEKILTQVEGSAFAKGADYEGEGIKWQAKDKEGTWVEAGKSVKYKLVKN